MLVLELRIVERITVKVHLYYSISRGTSMTSCNLALFVSLVFHLSGWSFVRLFFFKVNRLVLFYVICLSLLQLEFVNILLKCLIFYI